MLNVFTLANGRLFQEEIESLEELARFKPIWVDLESPTTEEPSMFTPARVQMTTMQTIHRNQALVPSSGKK